MIKVLDTIAPLHTSKFSKSQPEWLTAEIIEMMKDRDQALKKAMGTGDHEDRKIGCKLGNKTNIIISKE